MNGDKQQASKRPKVASPASAAKPSYEELEASCAHLKSQLLEARALESAAGLHDALGDDGTNDVDFESAKTMAAAASQGRLEVMKALRAGGCAFDAWACRAAAKAGHIDALKWLHGSGCPWDVWTTSGAAVGGHLDVLVWLRDNKCPWNENTCSGAACGGHLHILKWARARECPWDEETCAWAARGGHLELLQWARQQGCPWDEETCAEAAKEGKLAVLQWAHANGCPWNEATTANAAQEGHLEVLKWLLANGCPCDRKKCRTIAYGEGHANIGWGIELTDFPQVTDDPKAVKSGVIGRLYSRGDRFSTMIAPGKLLQQSLEMQFRAEQPLSSRVRIEDGTVRWHVDEKEFMRYTDYPSGNGKRIALFSEESNTVFRKITVKGKLAAGWED